MPAFDDPVAIVCYVLLGGMLPPSVRWIWNAVVFRGGF